MTVVLFLKGGQGSGNFGHGGRPGQVGGSAPAGADTASSAEIADAIGARAYWRAHFAGKTLSLHVRTKSGEHAVRVVFDDANTHMWTRSAAADDPIDAYDRPRQRQGPRTFDAARAAHMDLLVTTISHPWRVLGHHGRQFFLGARLDEHRNYVVILQVGDGQTCHFVSAYPQSRPQIEKLLREGLPERPGLKKSEAPDPFGAEALAGLQFAGARATPEGACGDPVIADGCRSIPTANMAKFFELYKALGSGERWITIRPNGADSKGQPVLIQPQPDGSAKVIGGAGGALNHLRLTGVKPKSSYQETLKDRATERRARAAEQRKRDKEAGLTSAKAEAHERITAQRQAADKEFVNGVADAMGWKPEDVNFDPERHAPGAAPDELPKLQAQHEREMLSKAKAAVNINRSRLLQDADHRAQVDLGEVPLETSDPDTLTVQDIDPVSNPSGLGFSPDYGSRAEANGAGPAEIEAEAAEMKQPRAGGLSEKIQEGSKLLRDPTRELNLKPKLVEAAETLKLLKLEKRRRLAEAAARTAHRDINEAVSEPKAAVIDVDDAKVDDKVAEEVANDLRTIATRNFLNEVSRTAPDPVKALSRHVGVGAYNAINSLALAAGGAALVDRSVVDVLGVAGAAEVLARRLHSDLDAKELGDVVGGMEDYHLHHYQEATAEALTHARELQDLAAGLELETAGNGGDLAILQEVNRRRADAIGEAQQVLGQTLGETEANAALVYALRRGRSDRPFQVSLGQMAPEAAIRQLRAIGLQRGDYTVETAGGVRIASITPGGMDRLAQPVNKADLEQVRRNLSIIQGDQDEEGWLPRGFADRPDLGAHLKPGVAATLATPFQPGEDLDAAVRSYIGGRAADGDPPADIVSDLQSAEFFGRVGPARAGEYRDVLDRLVPLQDADGNLTPPDALRSAFDGMADAYVKDLGGDVSPIHRQTFKPDEKAIDAVHRAIAAEPTAVAAYKPVGELTSRDQGALRNWFAANVAKEDAAAADMRRELGELVEPERHIEDMFGAKTANPAWSDWKARRDELSQKLDAASTTWPKYIASMGSPKAAYAAVQDLVQSRVSKAFADTYNTLHPETPLKLGRGSIRGAIDHLDAVDPKARDARLARERALVDRLRDRVGGRYAAGGVQGKLDAARREEAGLAAAQMGFFAGDDDGAPPRPMGAEERHSLGHAAERQLASLIPAVGANFKAGRPVKFFKPTMSGGAAWARQRAIKLIGANRRVALSFGTGAGKAQPLTAKVLTPGGWRLMGDLTVGDEVIAGDGTVTTVTGVFPQGEKDIYRVIMDDGSATDCCDDHLWLTTTRTERKRAIFTKTRRKGVAHWGGVPKPEASVKSLSEIRTTLRHLGDRNHQIPLVSTVQFLKEWRSSIDPYLVGVLIGDGGVAGGCIKLSSIDQDLLQSVTALLPTGLELRPDGGCDYRITTGQRGGAVKVPNAVLNELRRLGLHGKRSADKGIPAELLVTSPEARVALLQGLMDTDGSVNRRSGAAIFYTISAALASDVIALVNSLGGICRRSLKRAPTYTHKGERRTGADCHVLYLSLPSWVAPFRLARKASLYKAPTKYAPRHRIISEIVPVGRAQAQCIAVAHPSHLYVTDDFIVTHNTAIGLGAFADLHGQGKAKKGVFVVPSIAQGGFGADALRFLQANKFKWHAQPGASREERLAAYKDPDTHFAVVTHQAFRDDVVHLGATQAGIPEGEMASQVAGMSRADRKAWAKGVMDAHGMSPDFLMVDEGHNLLNREGKEDSGLANVLDAVSDNTPYYVNASGDPVKNDVSEAFSLLQKMDPERYTDRAAFMRRYGPDTAAAKDGLRRELARFQYPSKIDPDVAAAREVTTVQPSEGQREALTSMDRAFGRARLARLQGGVDVAAVQEISPAAFVGAPLDQHEAIAKRLSKSLGLLKNAAVQRTLNAHPQSAKADKVVEMAKARKGKPGVVFAHTLDTVSSLKQRLEGEGFRVVTITGKDSAEDKANAIQAFNPDAGERKADIVVASDAGATGANLQSGTWLVNYDTPDTAMTHAQREGRINRTGQVNDIELHDLAYDHPAERRARARLKTKYALRELMTTPMETLDDTGIGYFLKQRRALRMEEEAR